MTEQVSMVSDVFLKELAATYRFHEPLILAALVEQRELKMFVALLRSATEMSDESETSSSRLMVETCNRLLAHMDNLMAMLKCTQNLGRQIASVMEEYQ
jgi:hypothetical protein